jgi:hypothetical protein
MNWLRWKPLHPIASVRKWIHLTHRVGGKILAESGVVPYSRAPMLSLGNAFTDEDVAILIGVAAKGISCRRCRHQCPKSNTPASQNLMASATVV